MEKENVKTIVYGICFIVFWIGLIFLGSWVNTPTHFYTQHYVNLSTDNQTRDALEYLADIKEHQTRENNLDCENRLLNQSLYYEKMLTDTVRWYEVEQFKVYIEK